MSLTPLVSVLAAYPEKSPFDWVPLLHNLVPWDKEPDCQDDKPAFIAGALEQARASGMNPLYMWYGTNPLTIFEDGLEDADFPITAYSSPPPLPAADLSHGLTIIEQLNIKGTLPIFRVQVGDDIRVMKVFPDLDRDEEVELDGEAWGWSMVRFRRESEAYGHLLHFGACEKGVVPMCYGWAELPLPLVAEISDRYGNEDWKSERVQQDMAKMKGHRRAPKVLILEYIADAVHLSVSNATAAIAQSVLRAFTVVHACYVKQEDLRRPNILIRSDNRVVLIDFDNARCMSLAPNQRDPLRRQDFLEELAEGWAFFYGDLLPDKRIGFHHWLY